MKERPQIKFSSIFFYNDVRENKRIGVEKYDLIYNDDITIGIKQNTTMRKKHSNNLNWMEQSGMFFERK